jgi:hypothetical protein
MIKHPFNIATFTTSVLVIGLLTVVSFFGAWAYEEGTLSSSILANLYKLLRFPMHTVFWDFFNQTAIGFYSGLILNTIFYAFLSERLLSFIKRQNAND